MNYCFCDPVRNENVDFEQNTRHYIFFRIEKTWEQALEHCQNFKNPSYHKGSLALVKNELDLESIREAVPEVCINVLPFAKKVYCLFFDEEPRSLGWVKRFSEFRTIFSYS